MPFFEAGTEVFLRDWQETVLRVVVRDSVLREKDPILGIVNFSLKDVFAESSEATGLYSLQEGIGFGLVSISTLFVQFSHLFRRINVSLLFKAVDAQLPKNLRGWDTGTVEILDPIKVTIDPDHQQTLGLMTKSLTLSTTDSTEKIPKSMAEGASDSGVIWNLEDTLRLPVYSRFNTALTFQFGSASNPAALASCWLKDLPDDEEQRIKIPVVVSKDLKQLRQNAINEVTAKTHDFTIVGWLETVVRIDRGLDPDHEKHAKSQARRHTYET